MMAALALASLAPAGAAIAQDYATAEQVGAAIAATNGGPREIRQFYQAREFRPLWIRDGALGDEADALLELIRTARADGLDPDDYRPRAIASAIDNSRDGSAKALARAELLLSRSFATYVRDVRALARGEGMIYADRELVPQAPLLRDVLERAGGAESLGDYLRNVGWMHPIYAGLRRALVASTGDPDSLTVGDPEADRLLRLNLARARFLPVDHDRYVLVDAAAARLWMYEGGRVRGSMRVVVGKPSEPTPMMAGLIRYASLNPYWNIPPDLARLRVAAGVRRDGPGFLKTKGYQVLSDWSDDARVIDPAKVDWGDVEAGRVDVRVRQVPGPSNAMGRMKFMFPNELGIYLHDTPEKGLLREEARLFSSGCVRLEDAPRLGRWLFGRPLKPTPGTADQRVDLPQPVPVYITYLTAAPEGETIVFREDVYQRDGEEVARAAPRGAGAAVRVSSIQHRAVTPAKAGVQWGDADDRTQRAVNGAFPTGSRPSPG